jgi:hypothetical protein
VEDVEYPPPQPLDGEIDRIMETDDQKFVVPSENPAHDPNGGAHTAPDEEVESDISDDEDEEEPGDVSLGEEDEIDEEDEGEGDEDEEMQDAEAADEDTTMQSIENNGPTGIVVAQPV